MTGRRLYDLYCDAHRAERNSRWDGSQYRQRSLLAWPFLASDEKRMWTAMARRLKGIKR